MVPFSRNHCGRLTFILSTHKASLTRRGSVRNWGKELHLSPHASSLWYGLVVFCFLFFFLIVCFGSTDAKEGQMKPPNPKPTDAFPSLSPGTREAFPNLALTIRGLLWRTASLASSLLGAPALAVLAAGLSPWLGPYRPASAQRPPPPGRLLWPPC